MCPPLSILRQNFILKYTIVKLKTILLFSHIAFAPILISAQSYTTKKTAAPKALKAYNEGIQNNLQGKADKALASFTDALKADATFIDAQIQQAAAYYKLGKLADAELAFEKVEQLDANYEPEILFSLGNIEVKQDKSIEAAEHYEKYARNAKANATKRMQSEKTAKDLRFVDKAMKSPVPFNPISLGDKVNSPTFSEYLPSMTADGETLVYTARINRQEDFYMSKKVNGEWQKGTPITELNTDENEGAQCISPDGRNLFFTACNRPAGVGVGSCDIFYAQLKNGKWTPAKYFPPICTEAWESQPTVSADGRTIYFSSDRKGGIGGRDIWYVRFENGKWSEARNVGKPINTPFDEQAPFLHPDGVSMFFTSNGHIGLGGQDMYMSRMQADSAWQEPLNLGYPINTKTDEATLSVAIDGKTAYYAKTENAASLDAINKSQYDLYMFELPEAVRALPVTYAKVIVIDAETKAPLPMSKAEVIDLATQRIVVGTNTDELGSTLVCLPLGKNFAFNVSKEKYAFQSENFNLTEKATLDKPFVLTIKLQPIAPPVVVAPPANTPVVEAPKPKEEKAIILKNVFFDTDKDILRPESFSELNKLKQLLLENPAMRIELRGHTDSQGSDAHNLDLSARRALAVVVYLTKNGIDGSRLQSKGFGETAPIDSNDTVDGRQNNRRTEFIILR
jgi:outer membrane protein OmpA-like peptidoglycan-associated protein